MAFKIFILRCRILPDLPFLNLSASLCTYPARTSKHSAAIMHPNLRLLATLKFPKIIKEIPPLSRAMAGHSHWQNIQRIKAGKDEKKSEKISLHCSLLRKAIHEGGGSSDPKLNSKLDSAISAAKVANVPQSTIDSICKKALNLSLKLCTVELQGPGLSSMIVELEAENLTIAIRGFKTISNKYRYCKVVTDGTCLRCFEHKGLITVADIAADGQKLNEEQSMNYAVEAGAEEVNPSQDENGNTTFEFLSSSEDYYKVKGFLEKSGLKILNAYLFYIPIQSVDLDKTDLEHYEELLSKIDRLPDVTVLNVYDNVLRANS